MIKLLWPWLRRLMFVCILLICVVALSGILQPTYDAGADWPTTATFCDFYKLKENTVDVLFMGSSHAVRAFSPQELYNSYGLTSYNLSSEEQNMLLSYFWLKEALRTQNPQVVVLDGCLLFDYMTEYPLNIKEGSVRKTLDPMHMSSIKIQAIHAICKADPEHNPLSYYFPLIRYHDRWKEFDISVLPDRNNLGLMGYSPKFTTHNRSNFDPFYAEDGKAIPTNPLMQEYLDRITALCKERGIRLLLTKTPSQLHTADKHCSLALYANQHELDLIDFNESEIFYSGIDFWYQDDCYDIEHANHWGAVKLTEYIGEFLTSEYGLEPHEDPYWEESNLLYQQRIEEGEERVM